MSVRRLDRPLAGRIRLLEYLAVRIRSLLSAAMLAALLAGCGGATTPGAAATVDGEVISRERLESAVRELTGDSASMDAEERNELVGDTQRRVLSFLIQAQAIINLADERGITVDPAEEAARFEEDVEGFGGEEALAQQLSAQQSGLTVELYRDVLIPASLRLDLLREELLGEVEVEEVETRTVRHILVETEPEAQAIVDELADGADFAELAQQRSTDPGSGAQGGELGDNPRGAFVPPFDDAVWSATIGEVVGPVESDFGFHVLEVTDEGSVEQAAGGGSRDQAAQGQLDQLLASAFADAEVTVAPGLGRWDAELQQVVAPERVGQGAEPGQQPGDLLDDPVDAPAEE
ncbi:peptidylprolyl isomerase [Egicoccus sp. AB-alg6-2]|uniref:peptidylprolyl isomerase n=1 Tax=Egicoccus sp. AB-alg6-2 TaxID=3242692 RepID=UPI00359CD8DF